MATMLDPQVDAVRLMADATAEWIATLGGSPQGTPGSLVAQRSWDDYSVGRADAMAHLGALDLVYAGVIEGHRAGIDTTEEPDPVTEDMLIGQSAELELFHWFVRAHLENSGGELSTRGATNETSAARQAGKRR
ncbi:MAG: ferritin-like domain-containing protein [Nocardioidaceae bacterium]